MTWIKICGITNPEDAGVAVTAGADALGFVFYEKSLRYIRPDNAQRIIGGLAGEVEKVGVFANESAEHISQVTRKAGLTAVQLCGNESVPLAEYFLASAGHAFLKVIPVCQAQRLEEDGLTVLDRPDTKKKSFALLVDSTSNGSLGGSGKTFDWRELSGILQWLGGKMPLIVAGGLAPENVSEAIRILKPWGVDVSSGVEASPGKKDPQKIRDFVAAVRATEKSA
jgi:phosphoribosylanthranilate isomerase